MENVLEAGRKAEGQGQILHPGRPAFMDIGGMDSMAQAAAYGSGVGEDKFKDMPDLMKEMVELLKKQNNYTDDEAQERTNQAAKQGWYEM